MKLEVLSGIHSNKSTKECKFPLSQNTIIKIDGKKLDSINYFEMSVDAGGVVKWSVGYKELNKNVRLPTLWTRIKFFLKHGMRF